MTKRKDSKKKEEAADEEQVAETTRIGSESPKDDSDDASARSGSSNDASARSGSSKEKNGKRQEELQESDNEEGIEVEMSKDDSDGASARSADKEKVKAKEDSDAKPNSKIADIEEPDWAEKDSDAKPNSKIADIEEPDWAKEAEEWERTALAEQEEKALEEQKKMKEKKKEEKEKEKQSSHEIKITADGISFGRIHVSKIRLPLVGMFISATVLLISVLVYKDAIQWREYAITVPSATMCLSFAMLLMTCSEDFYKNYGKIPNQITFLWNFVGACFLTFKDPFTTTGNGYFASWWSVICSAAALGFTATAFKSTVRGMGALSGLLCSSIIVIVAIIDFVGKDSFYRYEAIYAMCVSVFTLLVILIDVARQKMTAGKAAYGCEGWFGFVFLCLLAILWVVLAAICTFRGPFLDTGNGYFGCWVGAACACFAAFAAGPMTHDPAPTPKPTPKEDKPKEEMKENWADEDASPV